MKENGKMNGKELRKQTDLFAEIESDPEKIIPKIPYKFYYIFEDDEGVSSKLMIEDWEVFELYKNCLRRTKNEEKAIATLAHEFGHFIDYLPDSVLEGTALGKILVIKDLRKGIIAGDSVSEETFQDYIKERKRLLNNITRLQRRLKEGAEFAREKDGPKVPIQDRIDGLTKRLRDLEGQLLLNKDIRADLWKVSQLMRPVDLSRVSDSRKAYRLSAVEMYADFASAILIQPDMVAAVAPTTWKLWHENLKKKPKFRKKYDELQALIRSGETNVMERQYK
ncbi:MAG: hypothetical protein IIC74_06655, partial [Bacteroidetes bacterium]|nr:hypothetical protein [Bacteroidota bacterium]